MSAQIKSPLTIRVDDELKKALKDIARKEYRPLATQIVKILKDFVKDYPRNLG